MAEPTPIYPYSEPGPEPGSPVIVIDSDAEARLGGGRASFFETTIFHAGRSLRQLRDTAQTAFLGVKRNAVNVAEDRPLHLVFGVAIAAFVAGSGLRIWRSHHE